MKKRTLEKNGELFHSYLKTPDEAEKCIKLVENTPITNFMIQSNSPDNYVTVSL